MKAVRVVVEGLGERKSPVASWRTIGLSNVGIVRARLFVGWGWWGEGEGVVLELVVG